MPRASRSNLVRVLALTPLVAGFAGESQAFTLITLNSTVEKGSPGVPFADGPSETSPGPRYTVSDDGCRVVFTSRATNLATGQNDGNGDSDVFLYEGCAVDKVTLVSHAASDPNRTAQGRSDQPVISPDGRFVVFRSTADDIVPERVADGSYQGQTNVFVWDSLNDTFELASHRNGDNQEPGDRDSQNGVISRGTGQRYVAFESVANNLVDSQAPDLSEIYRYRLGSGGTPVDLVSLPNTGLPTQLADGGSFKPAINGPGLCIVYESEATNLVSDKATDDLNARRDVFRWMDPRVTILLSHAANQALVAGDGESTEASIDDVCERFAFKSTAKNLALNQNDGNGVEDVFHAGNSGNAILASHRDGDPDTAGNGRSLAPILSRNGGWIAFESVSDDLASGQVDNGTTSWDVFLHEIGRGNRLVSHTAGDEKRVANAESRAPEISTTGLYVAFESKATDLDPNQNDPNGDGDVFLYNTNWNNTILASPRHAATAIPGNRQSRRPALSGDGYAVAFTGASNNHIPEDPETGSLEDVFLFTASRFLPFVSVRSTGSQNTLEWIMPPVDYVTMEAFVSASCPSQYSGAGAPLTISIPPANSRGFFVDPTAYPPNTTRCYSIFIRGDSGPILGTDGPARTITARTVEDSTGAVQWANNLSGVAALTQVGIGTQNLIAVANEGGVYGLTRGATGGFWPANFWPFRATLSPIQGRPPVLPFTVPLGSARTTFVGSQDGRVYALDADRGGRAGGTLWYTTPRLGSIVQPGLAGMFTAFGGVADHLVVGARNGANPAELFVLDPETGLQKPGSPYAGGGASIGAVNTTAAVDYTLRQAYFTSLEFGSPSDPSLWCLQLSTDGFGGECWAPVSLPAGISGGPVERNGRVYVGDNNGQVWAFDAVTGASAWPGPYSLCGAGAPVKSFVLADRQGTMQDLYFASSNGLCAARDLGANPGGKWSIPIATIPNPSAPVLARIGGVAYIFVGSSNGRLYQIEADTPASIRSVLVRTGATVGAPAFDVFGSMIYVGTDAGSVYAIQAPLP